MATVTAPGFGGFDADKFRDAIRNTMLMGMPNAEQERATFKWNPDRDFAIEDNGGDPYNLAATPVSSIQHPEVQVPVAVEFISRAAFSPQLPMGEIQNSRVIITILDLDFEEVRGADLVQFDTSDYEIDYVAPPIGLFDVTVYQIYATAIDEAA